jgi:hypothetical protein
VTGSDPFQAGLEGRPKRRGHDYYRPSLEPVHCTEFGRCKLAYSTFGRAPRCSRTCSSPERKRHRGQA